jgi:hypothetical protein
MVSVRGVLLFKANNVLFWKKRNCAMHSGAGGSEGQVIPQEESKLQGRIGATTGGGTQGLDEA